MQPSVIATLQYSFLSALATLVTCGWAVAGEVVGPSETSRGDPAVFAVLGDQGVEPAMVLERGTTLIKICDIKDAAGSPIYRLYWLEHVTQAAVQIHGRAEFIVISHAGHVLGTFDSEISEKPRCVGRNTMVRIVDADQHTTSFRANRLPVWLGGGSGFFSPVGRFKGAASVDGIAMPEPVYP